MNTTSTIQDRLSQIRKLLDNKQIPEALHLLEHTDKQNILMQNAYGVCLMRMGKNKEALSILRALAYNGLPAIAAETPAIVQANYATALLLSGDNLQAIDIIKRLENQQHPYVAKLKQTVNEVKRHLGLWGRFLWALTLYPSRPLDLGFAPGDL